MIAHRERWAGSIPGRLLFRQLAHAKRLISRRCIFFTSFPAKSGYAVRGGLKDMTKADLVEKVTALGDLTRRDGEVIVETILGCVIWALQNGEKIEIRGFGSFRIRQRNSALAATPRRASAWRSRPSGSPTSSLPRSFAIW